MAYGFNNGDRVTVVRTGKVLEVVSGPGDSQPAVGFIRAAGFSDGPRNRAVWALDPETRQIALYLSSDLKPGG